MEFVKRTLPPPRQTLPKSIRQLPHAFLLSNQGAQDADRELSRRAMASAMAESPFTHAYRRRPLSESCTPLEHSAPRHHNLSPQVFDTPTGNGACTSIFRPTGLSPLPFDITRSNGSRGPPRGAASTPIRGTPPRSVSPPIGGTSGWHLDPNWRLPRESTRVPEITNPSAEEK